MTEPAVKPLKKQIELTDLKLPTISQQGMKALEIINGDDLKFNELETAVSADPMLMGILLKYANSPMYRKFVEIKNVRKAISLLGVDIVKSAILICTMRSFCEPSNPGKEMLWEKSVHLAVLSKIIATKLFRKLAEEIELFAMMSQIGGLVLSTNFVDEYATVVEQALEKNISLEEQEHETFGVDRVDVTAYTLEKLRLPDIFISVLSSYFQNNIPEEIRSDTDQHIVILKLATLIIENEQSEDHPNDKIISQLSDILGLEMLDVDGFIEEYNEKISEGFSF